MIGGNLKNQTLYNGIQQVHNNYFLRLKLRVILYAVEIWAYCIASIKVN
ncbi:hypothetical protein GGE08_002385 [Muricauda sp. ARW1Y1]|nr:hypothetical protein [Muricauda sp. ARW1Y1]